MPDSLSGSRYVRLVTTRRSGAGVPTPFGALHRDGKLYCYTSAASGKVKRIRREPRVEIAPCTRRGVPTGASLPARARILRGDEAAALASAFDDLWTRQFGPLWWVQKRIERLRGMKRVVIEIVPTAHRAEA